MPSSLDPQPAYQAFEEDTPPSKSRWWRPASAVLLAVASVALVLSVLACRVLLAIPWTSLVLDRGPFVHEVAHVVIIRHGEKKNGTGLSDVGAARAQYLAHCMSLNHPSTALPHGPPTYVMASHGKMGKSVPRLDPEKLPAPCSPLHLHS